MLVYRISKCKYIDDLSGYGAFINGGRWNSEGTRMLYCARSASLALLETLAHVPSQLATQDFCLLSLEIPDKFVHLVQQENLPTNWNALPFSYTTQKIGNAFITENKWLALQIPSAILEIEPIILLNPLHAKFNLVSIISTEKINIDKRLKN